MNPQATVDIFTTHPNSSAKSEILAKLYLEGELAEISEQTKQDFCNWMMGEFQQLPFAVVASNNMEGNCP